jgi:hypothetical protein
MFYIVPPLLTNCQSQNCIGNQTRAASSEVQGGELASPSNFDTIHFFILFNNILNKKNKNSPKTKLYFTQFLQFYSRDSMGILIK